MNKQEQKQLIVDTVTSTQGCKATELAAKKDIALNCEDLPELIAELIQEDQLVEVEYVLPNLNYRVKSFLLPAHTKVTVFAEV